MILVALKNYQDDPDFRAQAVRLWTRSPWVHVEVFFQEKGEWHAIAARTIDRQVSCRRADEVIRNVLWWQFFEVPVPDEAAAVAWLHEQCGREFNYRGLMLSQVLTLGLYDPEDWFCSELAYVFLRQYSSLRLPVAAASSVSPAVLHRMLSEARVPVRAVLPEL